MTPAQQAAKDYAKGDMPEFPYGEATVSYKLRETAFLAGYEAAEGAFAEWCSENGWCFISGRGWFKNKTLIFEVTTTELYQLWQQSL